MKKTILISALAILIFSNAYSQEEKSEGLNGAWWGLAQIEFNDDETTSSFTILPVVGAFVSPSVTLGLGAGYTSSKVEGSDAVGSFIVMPLVRKYWGLTDNFYIFGQGDVPLTFGDTSNSYGFNLRPGIDYFIGGHFTIEATFGQFGYNIVDYDEGDDVGTTSLGFNMMNINFGLKYLF